MTAIVKEIGRGQVYDILHSRKPRATGGNLRGKRFSGDWLAGSLAGVLPCGGTRGWCQSSRVSMTSMRPPQHAHGGRAAPAATP